MALSSRAVWHVLERYYDLREEWPIPSTLGKIDGSSRVDRKDAPPQLVFVCDVRAALDLLAAAERVEVESVDHARRAADDADRRARVADREARWTAIKDVRDQRQLTKREWRGIAEAHRSALNRIYHHKSYQTGMARLADALEPMVRIRQLVQILAAV